VLANDGFKDPVTLGSEGEAGAKASFMLRNTAQCAHPSHIQWVVKSVTISKNLYLIQNVAHNSYVGSDVHSKDGDMVFGKPSRHLWLIRQIAKTDNEDIYM
jgi:hypothetical protein